MSGKASVVFDEELTRYDFGAGHPMSPVRVDLTIRLARAMGVFDLPDVSLVPAPVATDSQLELVHSPRYIEVVQRLSDDPVQHGADLRHGLGTGDTPTFFGMHHASAHIVGASIEAARRVWSGDFLHAVNISGGLHHAMADSASGFCIYNDPAIAIAWLLGNGAERVVYVDVDVHHGDGVQAAFYDDPRVLTISLHESPRTLFPGTGNSTETGGAAAKGSAVNVPLPPGTADGGWLRAFHAVVPKLLRTFKPDILVSQHGCDTHLDDPLAHLMLSVDGQRAAHLALHDLAHEVCGGKWVATGGGGYAIVDVVPRTWTHLLAVVGGSPIDPQTLVSPQWRAYVEETTGGPSPSVMTDGRSPTFDDWSGGYNPDSWLDRCVAQTRREVFPWHGIDASY
ncbi:MAG: acetoin utilization protein AcuC [Nocardioidaceae bacterium]